ncbi:MAG: hypothetical protein ABR563_13515 [Pyrinomonadaceae bacterium]
MRRRQTKARPKVFAAILGIMVLSGLVLYPTLVYRWRDSVRSEAQYKVAPVCASADESGCRREIESVFKKTYSTTSRYKTTHYVALSLQGSDLNGDVPVWWETDHSLYGSLKPGDHVTAEEWEGQIVAVRGAAGGTLRTEYDPTHSREGLFASLFAVPLITILVAFVEYKLIRGIRRGSFARG